MDYHIYLSYNNNQEQIDLPVLPSNFEMTKNGNNKSAEVISIGEITKLGFPKQFTLEIASEFPAMWRPYCNVSEQKLRSPYDYISMIERWRTTLNANKKLLPIRLVIVTDELTINSPVSIESFSFKEEAGQVGDYSYRLKLKEYRWYGAEKINLDNNIIQKSRTDLRKIPQLYRVKSGDTVTSISIKVFGNDSHYWEIIRINGLTNSDLINGLEEGTELRLY